MFTIPGIAVKNKIHESANSLVYQGIREEDNKAVILKVLKLDYPMPNEITKYKQEYEIARSLNFHGVIKAYSLEKLQNTLVIVFEDFGGKSLNILMNKIKFSLTEFLEVAIKITESLEKIHAINIIHKDINPSNIVFNPTTGELKIIDFGISTVLSRENPTIKNPNCLEGTIAYISPEQTGRMNRFLDYRTDFYSLGATFYEILTSSLLFDATDVIELVHCHIAKQPVAPHELNPQIPLVLSSIVIKLLAKTAEERYQSARGIKADLAECLLQLQTNGFIEVFPLCRADISDKFQITQKLYGREQEVETLLTAFERVSHRSEMILVSGYSGIGKSALVQVLYKSITKHKGYFISGKFDQYQRNIPYSAVVSAFSNLVRQLLTESEAQLNEYRKKLNAALGANGKLITDVIPELERIMGRQPAVPELPPLESINRFNLVFKNFISVFISERRLVIFLDDLQWADAASIELIKLLITAINSRYLFLIGAYRSNEVTVTHPLILTIDELEQKQTTPINHIYLSPLELRDVNQLISDTLKCSCDSPATAELVWSKTQGNPFFINDFLQSLYVERLLYFDHHQGRWQWDIKKIQAQAITDNVVELMVFKIQKLSVTTQQILLIAAAIGNQFELETLAIVSEKSLLEAAVLLHEAIAVGLVLPLSDAYKSIELGVLELTNEIRCEYKFAHDRIQQAAYSLIPEKDKQAVHWQVGQLLLRNTSPEAREQKIFNIVNQLNLGIELIKNQSERDELASLNLIAGKKAKASAAYKSAFNYFRVGTEVLGEDSWLRQYDLTLALYVEAAEAANLCTDFEQMERLVSVVLQQARTLLDKVKVYEVKIEAYKAQNKLKEAVKTALQVLKLLEVRLPESPSKLNIMLCLVGTKLALAFKGIENLIELPQMTAPDKLAAMRIMSSVGIATYLAVPELYLLIVLKQINLSVKYGNASVSAYAYANYALILSGLLRNIKAGYKTGQLALNLLSQVDTKKIKVRTEFLINNYITHWKEHIRETLQPSLEMYQSGLATGDLEFAGYSANAYCFFSYLVGKELVGLEREIADYSEVLRQLGQQTSLYQNKLYRQAVLILLGHAENQCRLIGEVYDEETMLPLHLEANDRTVLYYLYFHKLILCYLFAEYDQAIINAAIAEKYLDGVIGSLFATIFYFYDSLAHLAVFTEVSKSEQKRILNKVAANQKKMKEWARHAPMNFLHKFYLVEAERHRVRDQKSQATDYYDRAIELAKKHKYINEEALANELAAKFHWTSGKEAIAKAYMQEARYCYLKWGATRKVKDLDARYSQLLSRESRGIRGTLSNTWVSKHTTNTTSLEALDLATVLKASHAISSEIAFDQLMSKLIKIAIENAGAQSGFLILESEGKLLIEASGGVATNEVIVRQSIPVSSSDQLPISVINFVARTLEHVVLNDAACEGIFTTDPYIRQYQPQSILCVPIQAQGHLRGILYLENNLTKGAFTPARLSVLRLLCSQAAISIENAQLYEAQENYSRTLEVKVFERTEQLQHSQTLLSSVLNSSLDGVAAFKSVRDSQGKIIDFEYLLLNPAAEKIVGRDRFGASRQASALGDAGESL